jgi:hypothetical protein
MRTSATSASELAPPSSRGRPLGRLRDVNSVCVPRPHVSRSGSIVFVESLGQLLYVKVPSHVRQVPVGKTVWFSVRADLMNTGNHESMANRIDGKYIASEFLGSLETDVFEVAPGQYVHVEQHRHSQDYVYKVGEREMICWHAESGVLLEDTRRPTDLDAA